MVECNVWLKLQLQGDPPGRVERVDARRVMLADCVAGFREDSCIVYRGWLGAVVGNVRPLYTCIRTPVNVQMNTDI